MWALRKQHPRFFEVSIFLYAAAGLPQPSRAHAPPLLGAYTSVSIFQMDLATKFKMVTKCQQTKITSLNINTPYPIERAERVVTKYGDAILVTLQAPETFLKVFLPRRYGTLFGDEDLRSINDKTVSLNLKYLGTNPATNSYILELD